MSPTRAAAVAAAVTVVLWASAFIVIRTTGESLSPGPMACVRLAVGATVLAAVALRYRRPVPRGWALAQVVGYGVLWFGAYTVVLNAAERHLDPGTAALLVNLAPILVAVAAGVLFGDGFPRPVVTGVLVAFSGVVVIALGGKGNGVVDTAGIVLGLLAAVLYASGVLLQKVALRSVDAVTATWTGCAAGLVATLPFAPQAVDELARAPASAVLGSVFLGVGPTAIAFTTWAYALARTDAGRMAATTLCVPALAVLLSWLVLGEVPTAAGLAGGVLCLAGVAISRRRSAHGPSNRIDAQHQAVPSGSEPTRGAHRWP